MEPIAIPKRGINQMRAYANSNVVHPSAVMVVLVVVILMVTTIRTATMMLVT